MLQYTGHPFIDVGIATIMAFVGKRDSTTVTEVDLDTVADQLETWYCTPGALRNFLAGAVFPNSGFAQYAYDKPHLAHKKHEYADTVLRGYRSDPLDGQPCSFCGRDAVGTATREQVPLLNSRTAINFSPQGRPGLPICGHCMLAVHAMPLGCLVSHGRLLAVHSDNPQITYVFAKRALRITQQTLQMQSLEKMPNYRFPRTRVIEALSGVRGEEIKRGRGWGTYSLTAYHFTNSGQSADIEIHQLSSEAADFLFNVLHEDTPIRDAWQKVVRRGWTSPDRRQGKKETEAKAPDEDTDTIDRKNKVYEDIFGLPDNARHFLEHIFPPRPWELTSYSWELTGYSWELTSYFLRKVMNMEPELIKLLRDLGKRFAEYIRTEKRGFYFEFSREEDFSKWRRSLLRATDHLMRKQQVLITPDEFILAFTAPRGEFNNWKLHRDIISPQGKSARGL